MMMMVNKTHTHTHIDIDKDAHIAFDLTPNVEGRNIQEEEEECKSITVSGIRKVSKKNSLCRFPNTK